MEHLREHPDDVETMNRLEKFAELVMPLPLGLNLWKVQNTFWEMLQKVMPEFRTRAEAGDEAAQNGMQAFQALGQRLGFAIQHAEAAAPVKMAA